MYYSNGNYEAFADTQKPEGVDNKSAYIIGSGLAGLAAAVFLIRDAVKWKTTLNVYGTCIVQFQVWKYRGLHIWMSIIGLIKKILTLQIVV